MSTVKRTVILGVALTSIAAAMPPVSAQPKREIPQGVYYTVPERVVVGQDGSCILETRELGPFTDLDALFVPPAEVTVRWETDASIGDLMKGGLPWAMIFGPRKYYVSRLYVHIPYASLMDTRAYEDRLRRFAPDRLPNTIPITYSFGSASRVARNVDAASNRVRVAPQAPVPGDLVQPQDQPPGSWIGVMDPSSPRMIPDYLSDADELALDIMGWNFDSDAPKVVPQPDQPQQPGDGQGGVVLAPTFVWLPGSGVQRRDFYIYLGQQIDSDEALFEAIDIQGNSLVTDLGVLRPGATYLWFTAGISGTAIVHSEQRTFTTEPPCLGDADFSKTVNFADINAVLANWLIDYGLGTGLGDANFDGIVNFNDINAVLVNWLSVCP